jgi:hypothetical protein
MNDDSVASGLEQYLAENGFTVGGYTEPFVELSAGPLTFKIPNGPARQRAIPLHDLHHVATGYGTDLTGEAEIGAWELRAGCNNTFLKLINAGAVLAGLFIAPIRVWRAFRAARGARSLYVCDVPLPELRAMTVAQLRQLVGVPTNGVADRALRHLHARAPAAS